MLPILKATVRAVSVRSNALMTDLGCWPGGPRASAAASRLADALVEGAPVASAARASEAGGHPGHGDQGDQGRAGAAQQAGEALALMFEGCDRGEGAQEQRARSPAHCARAKDAAACSRPGTPSVRSVLRRLPQLVPPAADLGPYVRRRGARWRFGLAARTQVVVFDAGGHVLLEAPGSTADVSLDELCAAAAAFAERSAAMSSAVTLAGQRFEVHRWDPPCIYGRTVAERSEQSHGFAMCRVESRSCEPARLVLATYAFPVLSARVVPELLSFAKQFLGLPEPVWPAEGLAY